MREIKFRAWNTVEKEMSGSFTLEDMFQAGTMHNRKEYPEDKYIVLQYSGLKDKNGKEIYEGDILRAKRCSPEDYEFKYITYEVVWDDELAGYGISAKDTGMAERMAYLEMEVVGNKYENPELLEKSNDNPK